MRMIDPACTTEDKVAFLRQPAAYPDRPRQVEVIETHMSWVFLAGHNAYKLKKPVVFPFLDFTQAATRRANCEAEVRLNRRLAPDVYLGVEKLTLEDDGELRLDGKGQPIDWLVRMRRLPKDRMLHIMIAENRLEPAHLDALADVLSRFYQTAERPSIDPLTHLKNLDEQQAWNRQMLGNADFALDHAFVRQHLIDLESAMAHAAPLIEARIRQRSYVDGHGDLRPEHICFTTPIAIFDCLEFDDRLRFVDPFDELAFLSLESEFLGAAWVGREILDRMRLGECVPPPLFDFYTAFRATMRARMALSHVATDSSRPVALWVDKANKYLTLGHRALERNRANDDA
ncbi:hypothetical protein GCM10007920_36830 [Ciceribacter naphthalenivorans]|uniref:Aminoglycoside phosphotransferase domain-containing protein n=4 Tax=Pseudomonadota TaxID=1224 RepID=A0A512HPN5_9HYPH|nr:hypothetical protein RNA01_43540 [Ciceribacter naphthalenivorans]GLR23890.1 hypothetical protein GCM10007920_36830 [Ciceribacter naphthalenivorans]GLT06746.1 hypothetical protein GCM10007926_36830 [Sphingomonas psychrolutea]